MDLGKHIIYLRRQKGISQAELAEALGVSRQSVSKWETNSSVPDLDRLVSLASYFEITLDELVTGEKTDSGHEKENETTSVTAAVPPAAAHRTKAQSAGLFFLVLSAFSGVLLSALSGARGLVCVTPLLAFGLIAYFVKNHPIMKAIWTDYIMLSIFFHYATGISPDGVFLTFSWTEQMNYAILVFDWIWFILVTALIFGTAWALRKIPWIWDRRQMLCFILSLAALTAGILPIPQFMFEKPGAALQIVFLFRIYLRLAGITALITDLSRFIFTKSQANKV